MGSRVCTVLLLAAFAAALHTFVPGSSAELVRRLPGQPGEVAAFRQHSGYVVTDRTHGRALFYYFAEAANKPLSRPLTLWLSGGPGCSSLGEGVFLDHGPFRIGVGGKLVPNPYSWNSESNMLYLESPIGVGFSYSNTTSDYHRWNDSATARDNLRFLVNWLEEFPVYQSSDLFLAGDSYAGHYVTQLATLVLEHNRQQQQHLKPINLKGILLGNPLLDMDVSVRAGEYLWSHGAISDEALALEEAACNFSTRWREMARGSTTRACDEVFARIDAEVGPDVGTNYLLSKKCLAKSAAAGKKKDRKRAEPEVDGFDPCAADRVPAYLRRADVQKALHANTTKLSFQWDFCSVNGTGPLDYQLEDMEIDVIPLVASLIKSGIPIMMYSGDQDSKIPLTQTRTIARNIAKELNLRPLTNYAPWYDNKQVGGWSQSFGRSEAGRNTTCLTHATVRGAGHEVPMTAPSQALALFRGFLNGLMPPSS